ncbi:hypothetical protein Skr01_70110 [Sphaerisporangium krabiense]|nr:hypothetical protein Skr01_70110 [Sphaerisporangium krabiense]
MPGSLRLSAAVGDLDVAEEVDGLAVGPARAESALDVRPGGRVGGLGGGAVPGDAETVPVGRADLQAGEPELVGAQRLARDGVLEHRLVVADGLRLVRAVAGRGEDLGLGPVGLALRQDLRVDVPDVPVARDGDARRTGLDAHGRVVGEAEHARRVLRLLVDLDPAQLGVGVGLVVGRLHDDERVVVGADLEGAVLDRDLACGVPHLEGDGGLLAGVVGGAHLRQRDRLAVPGGGGHVGDGDLRGVVRAARRLADPDRGGDEEVAVGLVGADVVEVAVLDLQLPLQRQVVAAEPAEVVGDLPAVGDQLRAREGVLGVGVLQQDLGVQGGGSGGQDRAHRFGVAAEAEDGVDVARGVRAAVVHRRVEVVQALARGPDAGDRRVARNPGRGVLVAVPDRGQVPAGVQRLLELLDLVGGLDLDQLHAVVDGPVQALEAEELALARGRRVVELADRVRVLLEAGEVGEVVVLHVADAEAVGVPVDGALLRTPGRRVPAGVEQVDVAGAVVPGVLDRGDHGEVFLGRVELARLLVQGTPLVGVGVPPVLDEVVAIADVPHHVMLGEGEEVRVRLIAYVVERRVRVLGSVAHPRVRVELAGVQGFAEVDRPFHGGRRGR